MGRPHRMLFQSAKADAVAYPPFLPKRVRPVKPDCAIAMSRLAKTAAYTLYRVDSLFRPPLIAGAPSENTATQNKVLNPWVFCSFTSCSRRAAATEGFAKRARL